MENTRRTANIAAKSKSENCANKKEAKLIYVCVRVSMACIKHILMIEACRFPSSHYDMRDEITFEKHQQYFLVCERAASLNPFYFSNNTRQFALNLVN